MKITDVRTRVVEWRGKTVPPQPHFCTNPMDLLELPDASMPTFTFHGWLLVEVFTDNGFVGLGNAALAPLVTKQVITRELRHARAIQLVGHRPPGVELPLMGLVAAGSPLAAEQQDEHLNINDLFTGANHFALKVKGQSMIEDHIDDGDYVVIRKQDNAENGERVVAMIDNEVTLKRFHREKGQVRLEPANGKMQPIVVDPKSDAKILGVLVGVLRKC